MEKSWHEKGVIGVLMEAGHSNLLMKYSITNLLFSSSSLFGQVGDVDMLDSITPKQSKRTDLGLEFRNGHPGR